MTLDVTEQKVVEEALRKQEASFCSLAANLPGMVYRVHLRQHSRMQFFNDMTIAMTGYGTGELKKGDICSIEWLIVVEDRTRVVAEVNAAIREHRAFHVEYRINHRDGTERHFLESGNPVYDEAGPLFVDGIILDISEIRQMESALRQREEEFKTLVEHDPDVIVRFDRGYHHIYVNPAVEKEFGTPVKILTGKTHRELGQSPEMADYSEGIIRNIFETGRDVVFELEVPSPAKTQYYLSRGVPKFDANGNVESALFIHRNITERKAVEEELRKANEQLRGRLMEIEALQSALHEQATRDPLTGLFNRRYLEEALTAELARARREKYPVSFIMMDVDRFKGFNDTYGHVAGDKALQVLAAQLKLMTRVEDVVCRYGGEEFLAVLHNTSAEKAMERAEQWREAMEKSPILFRGESLHVTFSGGVAVFPKDAQTAEDIIHLADMALYRAKDAGRNRIGLWK